MVGELSGGAVGVVVNGVERIDCDSVEHLEDDGGAGRNLSAIPTIVGCRTQYAADDFAGLVVGSPLRRRQPHRCCGDAVLFAEISARGNAASSVQRGIFGTHFLQFTEVQRFELDGCGMRQFRLRIGYVVLLSQTLEMATGV